MVDGKELSLGSAACNRTLSHLPSTIYHPSGLVSDLLAITQVADGVVRLADLGGLLLNDAARGGVERSLFECVLVGRLGHVLAALRFGDDRVVILAGHDRLDVDPA